ncbi:MAG: helix-turn-helix transcriptional regulator [Thermomicrobiales bacterium]|nr:helix-turn-helix transcriptional regulator [Thermomicrobiales bacterium]
MSDVRWDAIVNAATEAAAEAGVEIADLSLDEIARRAGISRATLFRRIGSREALDAEIRARGIDPGGRENVRTRAMAAAAELIAAHGLATMTLDAVAARAECSIQALYAQFGGRDELLLATIERYSPLPRIEAEFANPPADLGDGVRLVYGIIFDVVDQHRPLIVALLADAANRPAGPTARYLVEEYLPRALGTVGVWLAIQMANGRVRPMPLPLVMQLFMAPIGFHVLSRPLLIDITGQDAPSREEVVETLAAAFLRAVALP